MDPPTYEEVTSSDQKASTLDLDSKEPQRLSIRDEVGASRSQHVAALISKLQPQIRERARRGLSRFSLLILPSDQAEITRRGELVGFPEDDRPVLIQLEGPNDGTQFWTQQEALELLRTQMLDEIFGEVPAVQVIEPLPPRPVTQPKSWFGSRKQSKAPETNFSAAKPPVSVEVELDTVNFRTETEFGLYETIRGRAILLTINIR